MENMDKAEAVATPDRLIIHKTSLKVACGELDELLLQEIAKRWNAYRKLIEFLRHIACVFDLAIAATLTGPHRDKMTECNIERMGLINDASTIALHSEKIHKLLTKLAEVDSEISELCSDDDRLIDASYERDQIVNALIKLTNE